MSSGSTYVRWSQRFRDHRRLKLLWSKSRIIRMHARVYTCALEEVLSVTRVGSSEEVLLSLLIQRVQ